MTYGFGARRRSGQAPSTTASARAFRLANSLCSGAARSSSSLEGVPCTGRTRRLALSSLGDVPARPLVLASPPRPPRLARDRRRSTPRDHSDPRVRLQRDEHGGTHLEGDLDSPATFLADLSLARALKPGPSPSSELITEIRRSARSRVSFRRRERARARPRAFFRLPSRRLGPAAAASHARPRSASRLERARCSSSISTRRVRCIPARAATAPPRGARRSRSGAAAGSACSGPAPACARALSFRIRRRLLVFPPGMGRALSLSLSLSLPRGLRPLSDVRLRSPLPGEKRRRLVRRPRGALRARPSSARPRARQRYLPADDADAADGRRGFPPSAAASPPRRAPDARPRRPKPPGDLRACGGCRAYPPGRRTPAATRGVSAARVSVARGAGVSLGRRRLSRRRWRGARAGARPARCVRARGAFAATRLERARRAWDGPCSPSPRAPRLGRRAGRRRGRTGREPPTARRRATWRADTRPSGATKRNAVRSAPTPRSSRRGPIPDGGRA